MASILVLVAIFYFGFMVFNCKQKKDVRAKMDEKSRAEQAIFDTLQHYSAVEKKVTRHVHNHFAAKDAASHAHYKELVEKGIEGNLSAKINLPNQTLYSDVYYKTIDREVVYMYVRSTIPNII